VISWELDQNDISNYKFDFLALVLVILYIVLVLPINAFFFDLF